MVSTKYGDNLRENLNLAEVVFTPEDIATNNLELIVFCHQDFAKKEVIAAIIEIIRTSQIEQQNFLKSPNFNYQLTDTVDTRVVFEKPPNVIESIGEEIFLVAAETIVKYQAKVLEVGRMRLRLLEQEFECEYCGHTIVRGVLLDSGSLDKPSVCEQYTGGCGRDSNQTKFVSKKNPVFEEFFQCKIKPIKTRKQILIDVSDMEMKEVYLQGKIIMVTAWISEEKKIRHYHISAK